MHFALGIALGALAILAPAASLAGDASPAAAVPFTRVELTGFWGQRQVAIREGTLRANFEQCEKTGRITNFRRAAGREAGPFVGRVYDDSDVYKALEGACFLLSLEKARGGDGAPLRELIDPLVELLLEAQQADGYLNTYFTLAAPERRWSNVRDDHELYCAGHFIEAALAHHAATGDRRLLEAAARLADHVERTFGPGPNQRDEVPGHQEIELALVKLSRAVGEPRYLDLARYFVARRGAPDRARYGEYWQDHAPVLEQSSAVGHAVRAMYLYCAMADLALAGVEPAYAAALKRLWDDVAASKTFITGGIGSSAHNEGFTTPYDLPTDTAYAETCAAIGRAMWAHRMMLLFGDGDYMDDFERIIYNGALSGLSLDGRLFFYENRLGSHGRHHRREWYSTACCPPNLLRFFASLGGYVYGVSGRTVFVNLYTAGRARVEVAETPVEVVQETNYPWDGAVRLSLVPPPSGARFDLRLRIPGWSSGHGLRINGDRVSPPVERGYAVLSRHWMPGDVVELDLPMPVVRMHAHPAASALAGRAAIMRGPVVYCLEQADNPRGARRVLLPPGPAPADAEARFVPDLLGGVVAITGRALGVVPTDWEEEELYAPAPEFYPLEFTAIPYFAWNNRGPGDMVVWIPESVAALPPAPASWLVPSASHCWHADTLEALSDRVLPANSHDQTVPRFTFWDRRGTTEWVQYDFAGGEERLTSGVEVYWFDDSRRRGGCRVPRGWRVLLRRAGEWRPVVPEAPAGVELDAFNRVDFEPALADAVRLEVDLREGYSAGILEWRVLRPPGPRDVPRRIAP